MKKPLLNLLKINNLLFFITLLFLSWSFKINLSNEEKDQQNYIHFIRDYINEELYKSIQQIDSIRFLLKLNTEKSKLLWHYQLSRNHFKNISFFLDYFYPVPVKLYVNGPNVPKAEFEFGYKTLYPHGYQVMEEMLYSDSMDIKAFIHELELTKQTLQYFIQKNPQKVFDKNNLIDMFRFEIIRIMSLYLNGYDCIKTGLFKEEIQIQLLSMKKISEKIFADKKLLALFNSSILYLFKKESQFKRLIFIRQFLSPLYEYLWKYYDDDQKEYESKYAINIRRKLFYDDKFFNLKYFNTVLHDSARWKDQENLGKLLFFDPILSGNGKRACASCHQTQNGFTTPSALNLNFNHSGFLKRNTPSLINVLFQKNFFIDGRALQLEDQASMVLLSDIEMHSHPDTIVNRLRNSVDYKTLFRKAFYGTADTAITYYGVLKALAQFQRSLIYIDTPFDLFLKGKNNLSEDEIEGYDIFAGKALCGSCHFFPIFNGLVPPFYSDHEYEVLGTPSLTNKIALSEDSGRYRVSKNEIHLHSYKTPGIRNWHLTSPYMHNGVFKTMEEVIDFYNKGGGKGIGIQIKNQTLPFDALNLSKKEIEKLNAFLSTLNSKSFNFESPKSLPEIKNFVKRKIGGEY